MSDLEVAGTPCQDHSSLNMTRQNMEGSRNVFYLAWVVLRTSRQESVFIHENVVGFGIETLIQDLGHLYYIERIVVSASTLGWATKRRRQFCVGIHKRLLGQQPIRHFICNLEGDANPIGGNLCGCRF